MGWEDFFVPGIEPEGLDLKYIICDAKPVDADIYRSFYFLKTFSAKYILTLIKE